MSDAPERTAGPVSEPAETHRGAFGEFGGESSAFIERASAVASAVLPTPASPSISSGRCSSPASQTVVARSASAR